MREGTMGLRNEPQKHPYISDSDDNRDTGWMHVITPGRPQTCRQHAASVAGRNPVRKQAAITAAQQHSQETTQNRGPG